MISTNLEGSDDGFEEVLFKSAKEICGEFLGWNKYCAIHGIEFNPEKSLNCQAYSVALFCALYKRKLLKDALKSQKDFLSLYQDYKIDNSSTSKKQLGIFL